MTYAGIAVVVWLVSFWSGRSMIVRRAFVWDMFIFVLSV